jgi:hypothetical protein
LFAERLAPSVLLVFKRLNGGDVGFYADEISNAYHVLDGNQSNRAAACA